MPFCRKRYREIIDKVIELHDDGRTYKEIADETGVPFNTIGNYVGTIRDPFPKRFSILWNGKPVNLVSKY
jgi:orotate phosphoribosyltransferase-like protein